MTTVAEFIAYLQTLPEDSKIEVVDASMAYQQTLQEDSEIEVVDDSHLAVLVDLILPTEEDVYSSETCWYDNIDRVLKLGNY